MGVYSPALSLPPALVLADILPETAAPRTRAPSLRLTLPHSSSVLLYFSGTTRAMLSVNPGTRCQPLSMALGSVRAFVGDPFYASVLSYCFLDRRSFLPVLAHTFPGHMPLKDQSPFLPEV